MEYPKALEKRFVVVFPKSNDYERALNISAKLYLIGKPIPAIDVLIASMALNRKIAVISKDKHFDAVQEVESDLILRKE